VTTASLNRLHDLDPSGDFDVRRFRPNIVVESAADQFGFVENAWVGRTLALGGEVRLRVLFPCPRCVMATLAQDDLVKDPGILRAAQLNRVEVGKFGAMGCVGVYAEVLRGGALRSQMTVELE